MSDNESPKGLRCLSRWAREIGVSDITVWRWRKRGWIDVINIAGRPYISEASILTFHRRAEAGEFAKQSNLSNRFVKAG